MTARLAPPPQACAASASAAAASGANAKAADAAASGEASGAASGAAAASEAASQAASQAASGADKSKPETQPCIDREIADKCVFLGLPDAKPPRPTEPNEKDIATHLMRSTSCHSIAKLDLRSFVT